jgi:hypothetical protein
MNRKIPATQLLLLLMISLPFISRSQAYSSKGTEFYVGYMENIDLIFNGPPSFSLVAGATESTNGSIIIPATGYVQDFSVDALTATEIFLPPSIFYPQGDETYSNTGIKVITNKPISLYAFHNRLYFSEATLVLPTSELGSNYIIASHIDEGTQNGLSELVIEGTALNTEIEITPSAFTFSARPAGIPFTIVLNEGQLFQLQSYGDLTGTLVVSVDSNKKIAVFSGMKFGEIKPNCGATSHVYDENLPVSSWGSSYIFVPFSGQAGDPLRIISSMDQTEIYFDGILKATLNTSEYYEQTVGATTYITASNPVAAAQFVKGGNCVSSYNGDPSMLVLTPLLYTQTKSIFKSVNTFDTPNHFVNIVCSTDGVASMTLDGATIASSFFTTVPGNADFSYAQLSLAGGQHILQAGKGGFQAFCYGFGNYNAYTFNTGFGEPVLVGIGNSSPTISSFDIFPNPMQDEAVLTFGSMLPFENEALHLRIYSLQGKLLRDEPVYGSYFNLARNGLKSGVYFCRLFSGTQSIATRKLMVE